MFHVLWTHLNTFKHNLPWSFLSNENNPVQVKVLLCPPPTKCFVQVLKNSCEFATSQLPQPCLKGDVIAIKIPEEEYQVQRCKSHLRERLILSKGDNPLKFKDLKAKLTTLWIMIGKWSMIFVGKGYYDFPFSSKEDMRCVCFVGSGNVKSGILRLFLWTQDFNPNQQRMSYTQCWVKIHNLPQEYWSHRIIFSIAGGIGTQIALDEATNSRPFGYFDKVLVEINLKTKLPDQILVEREGFAFFVSIEYENLPVMDVKPLGRKEENIPPTHN
ncbi:hypothetical protein Lal_00039187 [Lupinus albus]|nr:hypothetical protein Lal_00039187 [Lupinus albus]